MTIRFLRELEVACLAHNSTPKAARKKTQPIKRTMGCFTKGATTNDVGVILPLSRKLCFTEFPAPVLI
jgi:hypothetical protein